MPTRLLREAILDSERINQLDAYAEVFYRRLMSKVDDYGLFDARPSMLRTSLFPLRVDRVREADIARWIAACEKAGVIALYVHGGKPYGQMLDTRWQARSEPKHPLPPWGKEPFSVENNCLQPRTPVTVFGDGCEDGDVVGDEKKSARKRAPRQPCPDDVHEQVWADWLQLRREKRAPVTETVVRQARAEAEKAGMTFEAFLTIWCSRGSQGLQAEWLKPSERNRSQLQTAASSHSAEARNAEAKRLLGFDTEETVDA